MHIQSDKLGGGVWGWWTVCALFVLLLMVELSFADEADDPNKPWAGEITYRYDQLLVNGDRGRFREDNWTGDGAIWGIDRLNLHTTGHDPNGYQVTLDGRLMYANDYRLRLRAEKKDKHYLLLDFSGFRHYYDGSVQPWTAAAGGLEQKSDYNFFTDRRTYNVEFGLTPKDQWNFIFGFDRMVKDGKEVLLRGADGVSVDGITTAGVPIVVNQRGITDTFYVEAARTFARKYNLRIRQEFEQYRDNQTSDWSSYDAAGAVQHADLDRDHLGYTNWRTMVMFDSFLDEDNYVTANYMYDYLHNNSTRDIAGYHELTTDSGGVSRRSNVGSLGYRGDNFRGIEALSFIAGARVEDSHTEGDMSGSSKYYNFLTHAYDGPKPRIENSSLDETPVRETVRLVYQGIEKTTLSFDADLQQRYLESKERDRHGGVSSDPDYSRTANIDMIDQIYTFKAVRRLSRKTKLKAKFRIDDRHRRYMNLLDDTTYYPGYLGDYRIMGRDFSTGVDFSLANGATAGLTYGFLQQAVDTSIGGNTQDLQIHRGAATLSFAPAERLFLVTSFMLENYRLNTPAVGTAANHAQGSTPYDFRGNSYSLLLDGVLTLDAKTSLKFGFQHTEALGTVDYAGDYAFDSASVTLNFKCSARKSWGLGYRFTNFNNHSGELNDYTGHAITVTCSYKF